VVGDGGDVRWIVPLGRNGDFGPPAGASTRLRADRLTDLSSVESLGTTDFRAVDLECDADEDANCTAVLTGADGVVVRGHHLRMSPYGDAQWFWARDPAPVPRPDGGALRASSPLHTVSTKIGAPPREQRTHAIVVFGAPPHVDGSSVVVRADHHFVAASAMAQWPGSSHATLLVDEAGDIYLAR